MIATSLLLSLVVAQGDKLGKTDAQILSMGHEKWVEFYVEKKGDTRFDRRWADSFYLGARVAKNTRRITALMPTERARIAGLRKEMPLFIEALSEAQPGTHYAADLEMFWGILTEDLIDSLISREYFAAKPLSATVLRADLNKLYSRARAKSTSVPVSAKNVQKAQAIFERIARHLKSSPAAEARTVLTFLRQPILNAFE